MKWIYQTPPNNAGEWFAVSHTTRSFYGYWHAFNFWHFKEGHYTLYTFKPNQPYPRNIKWSENLCRQLLADLQSPQPSVIIIRLAKDGLLLSAAGGCINNGLPTPPAPRSALDLTENPPAPNAKTFYRQLAKAENEQSASDQPNS